MSKPNDAIDLTVVYEDAGAGRLTATIPALPGTISWGPTQAEARSNVVDALRTMLWFEPEKIPDGARAERVRVTLGIARRQTRDLGLDRYLRDRTDSFQSWQHPPLIQLAERRLGSGLVTESAVTSLSVPQPPHTPV